MYATITVTQNSRKSSVESRKDQSFAHYYFYRVHKLFLLTKKSIRIIYNLNCHDHTCAFVHSSKILKLHDLVTHKTMVILYKANNHSSNDRVQAFFKPSSYVHVWYKKANCFKLKKTNATIVTHCQRYTNVEHFNK